MEIAQKFKTLNLESTVTGRITLNDTNMKPMKVVQIRKKNYIAPLEADPRRKYILYVLKAS